MKKLAGGKGKLVTPTKMRIGGLGRNGLIGTALAALLFASGCMLGPEFKTPEVVTPKDWRDVYEPQLAGQPLDKVQWWKDLNDPVLDRLIEDAFKQNLSLQAASLRVVQARIGRSASGLMFLPVITGSGSISHSNLSTNVKPDVEIDKPERTPRDRDRERRRDRRFGERLGGEFGARGGELGAGIREEIKASLPSVSMTPELDVYDAGFDAIWELDLWGKDRQAYRIAGRNLEAAFASYDAIMISLAAEVARTYVDIRTLDQRIAAMNALLATMNDFVALTEERLNKSETLITDVKLAKLLRGMVQASLPQLEAGRRQQENTLCVLLGKAPQTLEKELGASGTIPVAPIKNAVGIPADLLRRRPDVRVAENLAAAQCARIGMAKARIMPSFSIFGAIGLASSDSDNFFESDSVRSAYGGLTKVTGLINYPIIVEKVRAEDAQFEEALLYYRETVLRANLEAENSMIAFLKAQDQATVLEGNVQEALEATRLSLEAYKEGKVIVSIPLSALTFLSSQQDQMWAARGTTTTEFISIYKALGGGWETRVDQELVPEYISKRMKEQVDWWSFTGKHDLNTVQVKR